MVLPPTKHIDSQVINNMINPDQTEITLNNHQTFYSIAYRHYHQMQQLVLERDQRTVISDEDVDFICQKNAAIQRSAMVVIIFSALTLEAFINHYGIEKFSRSFFDKHLDSLNPISKWLILPKLVVGNQLNTDGQPFGLLGGLFRLRNRLVHYKTRKKSISDLVEDEDWVTERHASDAIQAVDALVQELESLDPAVDTDWLLGSGIDPYA
jgi:hypothetical protein